MDRSTKTQRLREKMRTAAKQSKQTTLDRLPKMPKKESAKIVESEHRKQIVKTEIDTVTKEEELALNVGFRLLPSKTAFSKINANLYFDGQKLSSMRISVLQGPLATNDFEFTPVLGTKGIGAGSHIIKIEMYEQMPSGEKLACASEEVTIEYFSESREDRPIRIPTVKSIAGKDLAIASDLEKTSTAR